MIDKCPDCKGTLEKGCVIDHTYGSALVQRYAKAEVPTTPLKLMMGMHETDFNDVRRVTTYRCTQCNRLFQYAQSFVIVPNLGVRNRNVIAIIFGVVFAIMILGFLSAFIFSK